MAGVSLRSLQAKAAVVDESLGSLRKLLKEVKSAQAALFCSVQEPKLLRENATLKKQVGDLCQALKRVEIEKGVKQVEIPGDRRGKIPHSPENGDPSLREEPPIKQSRMEEPSAKTPIKGQQVKKKAEKAKQDAGNITANKPEGEPKKEGKKGGAAKGGSGKGGKKGTAADKPVDISRILIKVGQIVDVKRHPDADSLYVETVDIGEERPRRIISGLVKHYSLSKMMNKKALFMCNLKPAKMRGILSEGMIMCASLFNKVKILDLPDTASVGDVVSFSKFKGTPDEMVDAKKKIWEEILPGLKTDSEGVATYLGDPFTIEGKGVCFSKECPNYPIK